MFIQYERLGGLQVGALLLDVKFYPPDPFLLIVCLSKRNYALIYLIHTVHKIESVHEIESFLVCLW